MAQPLAGCSRGVAEQGPRYYHCCGKCCDAHRRKEPPEHGLKCSGLDYLGPAAAPPAVAAPQVVAAPQAVAAPQVVAAPQPPPQPAPAVTENDDGAELEPDLDLF